MRLYVVMAFIALTALVSISYSWNLHNLTKQFLTLATQEAQANWNKDQALRNWGTLHGGVYVRPNERTPPNPYLSHLPDRDVTTTDGMKLTLLNPAYMMNQMSKEFESLYGVKGKITGQILLNPNNKADPWELEALKKFDQGVKEVIAQADIDGAPFVRLMRPVIMKDGCVPCHGYLGFKVGDVRGGVSISVPLTPYYESAEESKVALRYTHGVVWVISFILIVLAYRIAAKREIERDIAEHELQKSYEKLEDTVEKRTLELRYAKEAAEKSDLAKSQFLASMSHELRTPMNAVMGFAQILQIDTQTPLSPRQNEHVESILAGGHHLLALINDILDLAKIEADQATLFIEEVDVNKTVKDCVSIMSPLGQPRDIQIIDQFSNQKLTFVRTDQRRLKQILINLLNNAVKYNKDGGTITISGQETDHGFLCLSIFDTGVGIPQADHFSVFEKFHRLDSDPMVAQEGTGIGLTVTKLLVERMAGQIGFESDIGQGSRFWFELPLASNQTALIWSDAMHVGVDAIDKDHQHLVQLLNKVSISHIDDVGVHDVISDLIDYTVYHFEREEVLMKACGYPDLENHCEIHAALLSKVTELADQWTHEPTERTLNQLRNFLRNWLYSHILKNDTTIAPYTEGHENKIRMALNAL